MKEYTTCIAGSEWAGCNSPSHLKSRTKPSTEPGRPWLLRRKLIPSGLNFSILGKPVVNSMQSLSKPLCALEGCALSLRFMLLFEILLDEKGTNSRQTGATALERTVQPEKTIVDVHGNLTRRGELCRQVVILAPGELGQCKLLPSPTQNLIQMTSPQAQCHSW